MKLEGYGWVTEIDGVEYYRSITDPTDEIQVKDGKKTKMKKKIKDTVNGFILDGTDI